MTWTDGPVALIGDACHPMLPTLAQGGCQAIEDAWVLAEHSMKPDLTAGLTEYEAIRKTRTSQIQAGARKMLRFFHHRGAGRQFLAYAPLWLIGKTKPDLILRRNAWIYEHDVTAQ